MNNFKVNNPRTDFSFEIEFTKAYKEAKRKYSHPAQLELAALNAQYPAILHPIQREDLLAGRIQFGAVGLGIQHQTGGFGFYIDRPRIIDALQHASGTLAYREGLNELLVFWRSECTDAKVLKGMSQELKEKLPSDDWEGQSLPAVPILRMAGSYLNFDKMVRLGLPGLYEEVRRFRKEAEEKNGDTVLFDCMIGALDLVKKVCLFYQEDAKKQAEKECDALRKEELYEMADVLGNIMENKPATMREAMQLVWIYSLLTPQIEFGRMDIYLGDFYVNDLKNNRLTKTKALALTQSFFRLIDHLDCEVDGRVIVGGYGRRNKENADAFCLLAIEACRTVKEVLPQFTLRFGKETPKSVWDAAMQCIEEGRTYPLLYNDEVLIPGIMKGYGVDRVRAESYVPLGCGEIEFDHYSIGTPSGSLNMLKILEITMNGGVDPVSGSRFGPEVKSLAECADFAEFYGEYRKQLDYFIDAQAKFEKYQYEKVGELHAFMYVTMMYDGCLERGKSIFNGGCASLNGTLELYGMVDAGDSLTAIKSLIYDRRVMRPEEMLDILRMNFQGYEKERRMMLDVPKYGNALPEADDMMYELHNDVCGMIRGKAASVKLDTNLAVIINNSQNTTLARWVGATPNGRKSGTAMANANNPSSGADKEGLTAMLNSILKLRHDNHAGMVQNLRLSKELYQAGREKVVGLLENYFERGGAQLMVSVVGKDDLQNAMERPEEYQDLIVRIGGFSARFVNLEKDVQKEIYERCTY